MKVGDSIVHKGRETLERAILLVESASEWAPAKVVYGDTDSLFVKLPGRDLASAFQIGQKIAEAVTAANPAPVKLKLEKVCCLPFFLSKLDRQIWLSLQFKGILISGEEVIDTSRFTH